MKTWEDILLDKNLPNPIPPPPYTDLDKKFGFINRENEEKELLYFIEKAKIEDRGFLIFLLGNQGRGKTAFHTNFKSKHSYPKSDVLYIYMSFPIDLNELNFSFIFRNYLKELIESPVLIEIRDKIFNDYKDIFKTKPETEEGLKNLLNKIKKEFTKFPGILSIYPNLVSFVITSTPFSPYYLYFYNFFMRNEELTNDIPFAEFVLENKEQNALTKLMRFSNFLKAMLNIKHTVLIIDDFDIYYRNENVYRSIYKILMAFRNEKELLKSFSIIFSGSPTFYQEFIQSLTQNERGRIENWIYDMNLETLSPDDFVDIIKSTFNKFWSCYCEESILPPENIFGIFNRDTLKFLYAYSDNDLREVLRKLYDLIEKIRKNEKINYYLDIKNFIKEFKINKIGLREIEVEYFKNDLDKRVKHEKSSQFINQRLSLIFNHLRDYFKSNKIFIEAKSEEKILNYSADVLLKVLKENHPPYEIIFEIKMKDGKVNFDEIKSRIEILKENPNRYLYWLTKSPLDYVNVEISLQSRILREKQLNETELAYLSYLINISEIFDLKVFNIDYLISIIKQSGIDLDLILNPPKGIIPPPEKDIDKEIEKIVLNYSTEKTRVYKTTVIKDIRDRGFKDYSNEFILLRIDEIARKLNFKVTQETIGFKMKEIR